MRRFSSVYLAGPDPWAPDAERLIARRKTLIASHGLDMVGAHADRGRPKDVSEAAARQIYTEVLADVRRADVLIANLTPWRGAGAHAEAAYLVGFASGLGKPVFAYMNIVEAEDAALAHRAERLLGAVLGPDGAWRDGEGARIEDFGLPETVMLWAEARRFFVIVTSEPLADDAGLRLCLEALRLYAA